MNPDEIADGLQGAGERLALLAMRIRAMGPHLGREEPLEVLFDAVLAASCRAVDLGAAVRARLEPMAEWVEGTRAVGAAPSPAVPPVSVPDVGDDGRPAEPAPAAPNGRAEEAGVERPAVGDPDPNADFRAADEDAPKPKRGRPRKVRADAAGETIAPPGETIAPPGETIEGGWRGVLTAELDFGAAFIAKASMQGLRFNGIRTAGELTDYVASSPPVPFVVSEPWPKLLDDMREALERCRAGAVVAEAVIGPDMPAAAAPPASGWRAVPIDALDVNDTAKHALRELGYQTAGQVEEFIDRGGRLQYQENAPRTVLAARTALGWSPPLVETLRQKVRAAVDVLRADPAERRREHEEFAKSWAPEPAPEEG